MDDLHILQAPHPKDIIAADAGTATATTGILQPCQASGQASSRSLVAADVQQLRHNGADNAATNADPTASLTELLEAAEQSGDPVSLEDAGCQVDMEHGLELALISVEGLQGLE